MAQGQSPSRAERITEFLRRLKAAPYASTFDEAYSQLCDILNAVEDEMTSIPFDPDNWQNDGRLYPPQWDSMRGVKGRPDVKRFRTKGHFVFIRGNGAIEIQELSNRVVLTKPGADGRTI